MGFIWQTWNDGQNWIIFICNNNNCYYNHNSWKNHHQSNNRKKRKTQKEKNCLLNPFNVVAQWVTPQPDAEDVTLTFFSHSDVLGQSRMVEKTILIIHCAQRLSFPTLAWEWSRYSWNWDIEKNAETSAR